MFGLVRLVQIIFQAVEFVADMASAVFKGVVNGLFDGLVELEWQQRDDSRQ